MMPCNIGNSVSEHEYCRFLHLNLNFHHCENLKSHIGSPICVHSMHFMQKPKNINVAAAAAVAVVVVKLKCKL
jgi:hypothetical protein